MRVPSPFRPQGCTSTGIVVSFLWRCLVHCTFELKANTIKGQNRGLCTECLGEAKHRGGVHPNDGITRAPLRADDSDFYLSRNISLCTSSQDQRSRN